MRGAHTDIHEATLLAAEAAAAKKATDIVVLDVGDVLAITERFVICSGSSDRQVKAIVDEVMKRLLEDAGRKPRSIEGLDERSWVLLDYDEFVVHVFLEETRGYYELERLWSDVPTTVLSAAS